MRDLEREAGERRALLQRAISGEVVRRPWSLQSILRCSASSQAIAHVTLIARGLAPAPVITRSR